MPDGKLKFLDGTAQFMPFQYLPEMDGGASVVVVMPEGAKLITIPQVKPEENIQSKKIIAKISKDGSAVFDVEMFYNGSWELVVRPDYENEAKRQEVIEKYYSSKFAGSKVEITKFFDPKNLDEPAKYNYTATIPKFAQIQGDEILVKPKITPHGFLASSFAKLPVRKYDVILMPPNIDKYYFELVYPKGYKLVNVPKSKTYKTSFVEFRFKVEEESDRLKLTYDLKFIHNRIKVEDYKKWRELAGKLDEIEKIVIHLKKK